MDPKSSTNPSTGGATPVNPPPSLEPKVFDLASINAINNHGGNGGGGNFMKKKPFIIGILSVLLIVGIIGVVSYIGIGERVTQPPKAADTDCLQVNSTGLNAKGDTAKVEVSITNNCSIPMNVKFKLEKYWCNGIKFHSSNNYIVCSDNGVGPWEPGDHDLQPGQTSPKMTVEQKIGNTGTCGSAQVDIWYKTPSSDKIGPYFGTAWGDNECSTTDVDFSCLYIESVPKGVATVTPGQKIAIKNSTKGSTGTWQSTWTVTSSGSEIGTIVPDRYNTANWTVPANPVSGQTWNIKTTVKDNNKGDGAEACEMTLAYGAVTTTPTPTPTPTPTVTPTPTPSTYKTCENNACVTKSGSGTSSCSSNTDCQKTTHKACLNNACVEVDGTGADSCTSDASCQPAAVPPPIPESGNTTLTLVGIVTGLAALGAALFLAL